MGTKSPSARLRTGSDTALRPGSGPAQDERGRKKRGGGPRTAAGKARVRLNPVRHAVLAQTPVIPLVEREEDWQRLREGVFQYFGVEGAMEEAMADRIAGIVWRLYRVVRYESEAISRGLREVPQDWRLERKLSHLPMPTEVTEAMVREMDEMLMIRLLPGEQTLEKVMRYETRLHRFLLQSVHQLLLLKGLRKRRAGTWAGIPELDPPEVSARRGRKWLPGTPRLETARPEAREGE